MTSIRPLTRTPEEVEFTLAAEVVQLMKISAPLELGSWMLPGRDLPAGYEKTFLLHDEAMMMLQLVSAAKCSDDLELACFALAAQKASLQLGGTLRVGSTKKSGDWAPYPEVMELLRTVAGREPK